MARAVLPLERAERSHQLHTSDSNCSRCGLFFCICDDDMETRSVVSIDETTALALAPIQVCNPVGDELRLCLPEIALESQTTIERTTMELCGQELDIPIPSAIPFVRIEVPHLLEIAGPGTGSLNINLNTFAVVFQERSWWTHLPPYREALPHAVACNIFKFVNYIDWIRTCQAATMYSDFDTTLTRWSVTNAKSAEFNAENPNGRIMPCPCAECWNEHYYEEEDRGSHRGWSPLRCFWIDGEYETESENDEVDDEDDDETYDVMGGDTTCSTAASSDWIRYVVAPDWRLRHLRFTQAVRAAELEAATMCFGHPSSPSSM